MIIKNKIKCLKCDDIIESFHRHDFKFCKCKSCAVDGGKSYLRRVGVNDVDYVDLSIVDFSVVDKTEVEEMTENENKIESVVNHPKHYGGDGAYECIKVLRHWMKDSEYFGFCRGNAIKYLCRVGLKDDVIQELEKAKWYIDEMIKEVKSEV